ncbi:MAG TPA: hypothetical protein PLJ60_10530 [Chryseolinea sp.]|nr:hypothetical protein [Chryseolinea sp.]
MFPQVKPAGRITKVIANYRRSIYEFEAGWKNPSLLSNSTAMADSETKLK